MTWGCRALMTVKSSGKGTRHLVRVSDTERKTCSHLAECIRFRGTACGMPVAGGAPAWTAHQNRQDAENFPVTPQDPHRRERCHRVPEPLLGLASGSHAAGG